MLEVQGLGGSLSLSRQAGAVGHGAPLQSSGVAAQRAGWETFQLTSSTG